MLKIENQMTWRKQRLDDISLVGKGKHLAVPLILHTKKAPDIRKEGVWTNTDYWQVTLQPSIKKNN